MENELRAFLQRYIGQGKVKKDIVKDDDVDLLIHVAVLEGIEQDIMDYGTAHPEAPFWDFHQLIKPMVSEDDLAELLEDDE